MEKTYFKKKWAGAWIGAGGFFLLAVVMIDYVFLSDSIPGWVTAFAWAAIIWGIIAGTEIEFTREVDED